MTDEQINIAIAESLGWALSRTRVTYPHGLSIGFHPPEYVREVFLNTIPNYTADLNACHEVWKTLDNHSKARMSHKLSMLMNDAHCWDCENATARQRCEAYLRTLGKWIE